MLAPALCLLSITACSLDSEATDAADDGWETGSATDTSTDDSTSDTSDTDSGDDCPAEDFPPVSPDPANDAYADPYLAVHCEGDEVIVESNGIPGYEFVELTPNPLEEQDWTWRFPQFPSVAAQTSEIPLLGPVGAAVNGLPFYGPNEGPFPDPFGDPVYNMIVDFCGGHTANAGDYHYHTLLIECLTQEVGPDQPSPVVGYSFDGFPIHGAVGCVDADCSEVVEYRSGWVQTGDPTTNAWDNYAYQPSADPSVLDRCNGHVGPGGDYHYHATSGFPYVLGCYAGTPTPNAGPMPGGMP
ncbi:YHYH protein [Enhygromyxa salina]|uniref:YHYH domain-containing protein n=1 Tax=Enhygromyxa salina TaxID=215803 RepID=A0A2S9YM57_9BACT|nr:YHYH protein [Enhygromyxa salina]PRQ06184.1 hypothetical protein ENSA7_41020 [Enhygromyxa salina]